MINTVVYILVCLAWGSTWVSIELVVQSIPPLLAAGLRFLISFPFFFFICKYKKEKISFFNENKIFFVFATLFYFFFPYLFINLGEKDVSGGIAALTFSSMPIFMLILSSIIYKEKISFIKALGIIIGFGGLASIIIQEADELGIRSYFSYSMLFAAAVMHALIYVIWSKKITNVSSITFNTMPPLVAGIALCSFSLLSESGSYPNITVTSMVSLFYLSTVASVIGFLGYFYLLKKFSTYTCGFVFIIFPIFAIILSTLIDGHSIKPLSYLMMPLVIFGFALTKIKINKNDK